MNRVFEERQIAQYIILNVLDTSSRQAHENFDRDVMQVSKVVWTLAE
jgi:hypothetical protein